MHKGMDTKILTCLVTMVWIFTIAEIVEGEEKGKMNPEISLPAEAAGWKWDGKEMNFDSKSVFQHMNGAAELYLAYAFQNLRVRRFEKPNQPPITLELYDMASSENAMGFSPSSGRTKPQGSARGRSLGGDCSVSGKGNVFCQHLCRRGRGGGRIGCSHGWQGHGGLNSRDGAGAQIAPFYP